MSTKSTRSNPYKLLKRKNVFMGKFMEVYEDQLELPNGKNITYEHFNKNDYVLVIPQINNTFVCVEQYRYTINKSLIEFPMGLLNNGENIGKAAARELEEETGFKANKLTELSTLYASKGSSSQQFTIYYATDLTEGKPHLDDSENDLTIKLLTKEEISNMILNGQITDAPTIAAFGIYVLYSQKK